MKKNVTKYLGMGFAESLIALMIAGMVGIVLMQISASTLRELAQLDIEDTIAKYAVSTSVDLQKIAIQDMTLEKDERQFDITTLVADSCYNIEQNSDTTPNQGDYSVRLDTSLPVTCPGEEGASRESFTKILSDKDIDGDDNYDETDYFRVLRVVRIEEKRAVVEVIVGVTNMAGEFTTNKDIRDFRYLVIIAL